MLSYNNDAAIKEKFVFNFAEKRKLGKVVQEQGFINSRNVCFMARRFDSGHSNTQPAWPDWLAVLADSIFVHLSVEDAEQFGTDFLSVVPIGVNLEPVRFLTAIKRHERQLNSLLGNDKPYVLQCAIAVQSIIDWFKLNLNETKYDLNKTKALSDVALKAAEEARVIEDFATMNVAASAAQSLQSIANEPARSARSAAWSAKYVEKNRLTEAEYYKIEANTLLEVLKSLGK